MVPRLDLWKVSWLKDKLKGVEMGNLKRDSELEILLALRSMGIWKVHWRVNQ